MSLHSFLHTAAPARPARITIRRRLLGRGSRLRSTSIAAALLSLGLASFQPAHAGSIPGPITWNGLPGDWFDSPSHWSNNSTPAATDDALNNSNAAMTLGQSTTVNSFSTNGAFTLNGGVFSGNKANAASLLTVNNIFTLNGGQINNFTLNAGAQQGGQPAPAVLVNNVTISNSIVNANLNLVANPAALVNFASANTVNGAITLGTTSNGLQVQDGNATLTLGSAGSVSGFGNVFQGNGNATLINNGLINATGGTLSLAIDNFSSAGTMQATGGGTLTLGNFSTTNTGALKAVGAGSVVSITRNFASGAGNLLTASGGGQIQVNNAALTGTLNAAAGTALIFNNSTSNSLSSMTINSDLNLATNVAAFADFAGVNTVNGAITLGTTSNGLQVQDGNANLILGSVGKAGSLSGFGNVFQGNGNANLTNTATGTINANTTGKTLSLAIDNFTNAGTTEATNGGTLALKNLNTTNTGTLAATGGGVLTVTGTLNSSAASSLNGVGGTININGAHLLGTLNGVGATTLIFNGDTSGNNLLNMTVNANLDLVTNKNAFIDFAGANTVTKAISLGTTSNGLQVQDGNATLTLSGTGSLTGFGSVFQAGGNAALTNGGLINATGGILALTVDNLANTGTMEATGGGTLTLADSTTTNTGALKAVGAGSVVGISNNFVSGSGNLITASGGGQVQVNGARLTGTLNAAPGTALIFNGGGNTLTSMTVNSNLDLSTNVNAFADFVNTNTVNGAITLGTTTGRIDVQDGNANLILSSTASLTGFGLVNQDGGNATLTNSATGTINANAAGKTLSLTVDNFTNAGTTEATNGATLTLGDSTTTNTGALKAVGAGSVVGISNNFVSGAGNLITASGGGQVQVNGARLTGTLNAAPGTALIFNGGGNTLTSMTVNSNLDLSTNVNAFADFVNTNTVNGAITLGTTTGRIDVQDGNANLILSSTASLTGFGLVNQDGGNATLTNNGLINASSAGKALTLNTDNFANTGTAQATNGATLTLGDSTTTNTGALKAVGAGSVVGISGNFVSGAGNLITASGGGQVQVNGAHLTGTLNAAAGTALIFSGSAANSLTSMTVNSNLDLATNASAFTRFVNTNTVNGAITLGTTTGRIDVQDGNANLILSNTASLTGFGLVNQDAGNATLTNNGLISANTSGKALTVSVDNFTSSGTVSVQQGAIANFNGLTQTAGLTQVDGVLNLVNTPLALKGGVLDGSGTINGNVVNTNGVVSPGDSPGTLTINGNYTQGSTGTLNIEFTNSLHDLLNISGIATTGGTLDVNYIDTSAFTGLVGSQFAFLDYGTLAAGTGTNFGFTVTGHNGFAYTVVNDASNKMLDLRVAMIGSPAPAVPEASTTVSLGLLLLLGLGGTVVAAKRKKSA